MHKLRAGSHFLCSYGVHLVRFDYILHIQEALSAPRRARLCRHALGALLLWAALSFILSPYGVSLMGPRYDGLLPMALYILTALGCAAYGSWHDRYAVLLGISVSICCAVAVLQLLGFNPLRLYPEGYDYYGAGIWYNGSFLARWGIPTCSGAFLLPGLPRALGVYGRAEAGALSLAAAARRVGAAVTGAVPLRGRAGGPGSRTAGGYPVLCKLTWPHARGPHRACR